MSKSKTDTTTTTTDSPAPSTRFRDGIERRGYRRTRIAGEALAVFATGQGEGGDLTQRLALVDASVAGIGARAEAPVAIGATFTLYPDKVRRSSWTGEVVRCVRDGDGYTLGLELTCAA